MKELKPCPFCGSTNSYVYGYQHDAGLRWRVVCLDCLAMVDPGTEQQKYRAIEAWNRRAAPENKALTLGQLEQMDGEPVWIEYFDSPCSIKKTAEWLILKSCNPTRERPYIDFKDKALCAAYYGQGWLAYARKPEGSKP